VPDPSTYSVMNSSSPVAAATRPAGTSTPATNSKPPAAPMALRAAPAIAVRIGPCPPAKPIERRSPTLQGSYGRTRLPRATCETRPERCAGAHDLRRWLSSTSGGERLFGSAHVEGGVGTRAALQVAEQRERADRVRDADGRLGRDQPADPMQSRARGCLPDRLQAVGERQQVADHLHPGGKAGDRDVDAAEEEKGEHQQVRAEEAVAQPQRDGALQGADRG